MNPKPTLTLGLLLNLLLLGTAPAGVLSTDSVVDGKTVSEWTAEWWKWVYAQPTNQLPLLDPNGSLATNGQPGGSVFFLANIALPGSVTRALSVPEGSYLLFPLRYVTLDNVDFPFPLSLAELRDAAAGVVDLMTNLHATVDYVSVEVAPHRVLSPVFSFDFQTADNLDSFIYGHPVMGLVDPIVSDGYWMMVEPLPVGNHVITFGGSIGPPYNSTKDITDYITVYPAAASHPPVADASATRFRVLAPDNHSAEVVLDGSRSSDPDNLPLTYSWQEGGTMVGAGVLSTNLLAVGEHIIVLVVSDGILSATNATRVEVLSPCEALGEFAGGVESAHLSRKNTRPLVEALQEACAAFDKAFRSRHHDRQEHLKHAVHELKEFQEEAREEFGRANPVLAAVLIDGAQEIIDAVKLPRAHHHGEEDEDEHDRD